MGGNLDLVRSPFPTNPPRKRKEKIACKKKRQEPKKNTGSKEETEDLVENFRKTTRGSMRCRRKI